MDAQPPALALSDIMHPLSPSPIPLDSSHNHADATITSMERTDSPEPITDEEVALCRSRLDELGISNEDHSNLNSREKELVHMILRLTEPSRPNAAQIVQQATIISELTTQRDFLIQKADEERARWHSEKDSWERSAEALISQRHRKDYYNPRNEDMERIISMLRAENADLRQKEYQTALRLNSLENEMYKLKPLLLMQPFPSVPTLGSMTYSSSYLTSLPYPASTGASALASQRQKLSRKRKRDKDKDQEEGCSASIVTAAAPEVIEGKMLGENGASTSTLVLAPAPTILPSSARQSRSSKSADSSNTTSCPIDVTPPSNSNTQTNKPTTPAIYQHLLRFTPTQPSPNSTSQTNQSTFDPITGKTIRNPKTSSRSVGKGKGKAAASVRPSSLASDARMEHLLLAARKIGRERTSVLSGLIEAEQQRDRKREQDEREKMEKMEKGKANASGGGPGYYRNNASGSTATAPTAGLAVAANGGIGGGGGGLTIVNVSPETINGASSSRNTGYPTSPRTPKRAGGASHYAGGSPFMYVQHPNGGVTYQAVCTPPPTQNVNARGTGKSGNGRADASNASVTRQKKPPTPMDSLLDAARSMMGKEENNASTSSSAGAGASDSAEKKRQGPSEQQQSGSPAQKRRRVASSRSLPATVNSKDSGSGRVRSALDVLADQADQVAAANEGTQRRTSSRKSKGKDVAVSNESESTTTITKLRSGRRTKARSVTPLSQSQVSNAVDKEKEKTKKAGGRNGSSTPRMISPAEQRVATTSGSTPVPRMIAPPPGTSAGPDGDTSGQAQVTPTVAPILDSSGFNDVHQGEEGINAMSPKDDQQEMTSKLANGTNTTLSRPNGTHDVDADGDFDTDLEMEASPAVASSS